MSAIRPVCTTSERWPDFLVDPCAKMATNKELERVDPPTLLVSLALLFSNPLTRTPEPRAGLLASHPPVRKRCCCIIFLSNAGGDVHTNLWSAQSCALCPVWTTLHAPPPDLGSAPYQGLHALALVVGEPAAVLTTVLSRLLLALPTDTRLA